MNWSVFIFQGKLHKKIDGKKCVVVEEHWKRKVQLLLKLRGFHSEHIHTHICKATSHSIGSKEQVHWNLTHTNSLLISCHSNVTLFSSVSNLSYSNADIFITFDRTFKTDWDSINCYMWLNHTQKGESAFGRPTEKKSFAKAVVGHKGAKCEDIQNVAKPPQSSIITQYHHQVGDVQRYGGWCYGGRKTPQQQEQL